MTVLRKYDPAKQVGWYRMRNEMVVDMHRQGADAREIALSFGLIPETIRKIVKACGENVAPANRSNEGEKR